MESNEAAIIHRLLDQQAQMINVILAQYGTQMQTAEGYPVEENRKDLGLNVEEPEVETDPLQKAIDEFTPDAGHQ